MVRLKQEKECIHNDQRPAPLNLDHQKPPSSHCGASYKPPAKTTPPQVYYEPVYENEIGVARAIFANPSEYPDELAFCKGAILRVIHNISGPELSPGWLYCVEEKTGVRGIVPGNRLQPIMAHFDQGFFNLANPLFDDFFKFSARGPAEGGGGEMFEDGRRRIFPFAFDDFPDGGRMRSGSLAGIRGPFESIRRASNASDDGAFRGIVRNIPIRVEHRESAPVPTIPMRAQVNDFGRMRASDNNFASFYDERPSAVSQNVTCDLPIRGIPTNIRRTVSSGQLSPTPLVQDEETPILSQSSQNNDPFRPGSFPVQPNREEEVSPVERLAQRLRNLASRNGEVTVPISVVTEEKMPPRQELEKDENKRASDASSFSDCGSNSNTSNSTDEKTMLSVHNQPPPQRRIPSPAPPMTMPKPSDRALSSSIPSIFEAMRPTQQKSDFLPSSVVEDMRRNESNQWKTIPTRINGQLDQQRNLSSISESEMAGRKRMLVTRMTDYLRMIERSIDRLRTATAPQFWREPHVLQKNLPDLRDGVTTINEALDHFVDSTSRIAIDNSSTKADELRAFLLPLRDSRALIGALRQALDLGGWTLATLARDKHQSRTGLDSIEQFLILVKRIPQECTSLLDWLDGLAPDPPTVCFMATAPSKTLSSASGIPLGPSPLLFTAPAAPPARAAASAVTAAVSTTQSMPSPVPSDDSKRLSSSSTTSSTMASGDSSTSPPSSILKQPNGVSKGGSRVTFADDVTGHRDSYASLDGASARLAQLHSHFTSTPSTSTNKPSSQYSLLDAESRILEEDDLESVLSERDTLYQDYAQLDDLPSHNSSGAGSRMAGKGVKRLDVSDEDRQLIRFYAPQLAQHTDALALAIDEFIDVVEHRLPPREFVQKGKLIILAAHKLIYIGDSVSQCVKDVKLGLQVRSSADHLCNLLKECVAATKSAAEEYPNIKHVQRMVDTIVGVSKAATDLKLLVEQHI